MVWESETEESLALFQSLEEERLGVTRDSLWRLANVSSVASVADDNAAETVRQALEAANLNAVIEDFVRSEGTGGHRPAAIEFEQQTTSSSVGMGKAEDLDDSEECRVPLTIPTLLLYP